MSVITDDLRLTPLQRKKRLGVLDRAPIEGLLIHEVFASIQGESTHAGRPCTFIRTTGCNLRCTYCDTRHAFVQGQPWSLDAILTEVARLGLPVVEVTGGEPLLQCHTRELLRRLCDAGYVTLCETSGSIRIDNVDPRVHKILDIKTPSSGEVEANLIENMAHLSPRDEAKFVVGDETDYLWAREFMATYRLHEKCQVLFGVVWESVALEKLARWIVRDKLQARMQVQMHKYIWDPQARGV